MCSRCDLLELPSLTFSELPLLSNDLQALIEATRYSPETGESLSAETVLNIMFSFFYDHACNHIKGMWLRRALELTRQAGDSVVEKQLQQAVAHAFTVLHSLFNNIDAHATALISPRVVACAALNLHLQDGHCTEAVGAWQPFRVQERSARATQSTEMLKRYATSEQLGEGGGSPLSQSPSML